MRYVLARHASDRGDDTVVVAIDGIPAPANAREQFAVQRGTLRTLLSWSQSTVLRLLAVHGSVTRQTILAALYGHCPDGGPLTALRTVDVIVCVLRKRLKPLGFAVKTRHGLGFYLEAV